MGLSKVMLLSVGDERGGFCLDALTVLHCATEAVLGWCAA